VSNSKITPFKSTIHFLLITILILVYAFLCRLVYDDSNIAHNEPGEPGRFHSGSHLRSAANRLQYREHSPSTIQQLYVHALIRSPADSHGYIDYFQYLMARNCCRREASVTVEAALERNPVSLQFYPAAIAYFLKQKEDQKAISHYENITRMSPESARELFPLFLESGMSIQDLIKITPRDEETLTTAAQYFHKRSKKEEWLLTIKELHSLPVEPDRFIDSARQALDLGELEMAEEFARSAETYVETAREAGKILAEIASARRSK